MLSTVWILSVSDKLNAIDSLDSSRYCYRQFGLCKKMLSTVLILQDNAIDSLDSTRYLLLTVWILL